MAGTTRTLAYGGGGVQHRPDAVPMALGRPKGPRSTLRMALDVTAGPAARTLRWGAAPTVQRARAATPKKSFTSRSALAGLSEAWTELRNLLSA